MVLSSLSSSREKGIPLINRYFLFLAFIFTSYPWVLGQSDPLTSTTYGELNEKAKSYFDNKSYALAIEAYEEIAALSLTAEQKRAVTFRLADSRWRNEVATESTDHTTLQEARIVMEDIIHDLKGEIHLSQLWAEVEESLADSWWLPRNQRNWGQAWLHYERAFDYWAGSSELQKARSRYLSLAWKISRSPDLHNNNYTYGYYGNYLPLAVLENLISIAVEPQDKAHAHYLMAMTLRSRGGRSQQQSRIGVEFEKALTVGVKTEWYDDALFNYAQWAAQSGYNGYDEEGNLFLEPDYEKALSLYRRLITEYEKGDTRYYDSTVSAIKEITRPMVNLNVPHVFIPGAEVFFNLNWREIETVAISIYPVNLARDVNFSGTRYEPWQWLQAIDLEGKEAIVQLSQSKAAKRPYYPMTDTIRLEERLSNGAYLIEAKGERETTRDIILVTDASLVLKTTNRQAVGYFCNALTGKPIPEGKLVIWEHRADGRKKIWRRTDRTLTSQGLANFKYNKVSENRSYFACAISENDQAFAISSYNYLTQDNDRAWRIYAYTDRPAYRPDETVYWKAIARQYEGESYFVPKDERITYRIDDPRGSMVDEGEAMINAFGAFWGEMSLTSAMTLGAYRINFRREVDNTWIGSATLFRLEEYKLPEFKVSIALGDGDSASPGAYAMGDSVTGSIQADYYFGGHVPNADGEVVIYRKPFYHWWRPTREFSWYYANTESMGWNRYGGPGQIIKREILQTDSKGKAVFSFDTPQFSDQDYEFIIEARITDASRREIVMKRSVKVTRQSYFVYLEPEHRIYQPKDRVKIKLNTLDANNRPVGVEGRLRLIRDKWKETWVDDRGREISGQKLGEIKARPAIFQSFTTAPEDYRLISQGYESEEIEVVRIKTNTEGNAEYEFEVPGTGYYRIAWLSRDKSGQPIKGDTAIWTAKENDKELGYRPGGVSIVVDKDTIKVGNKAPIMLTVPAADRYLLFSVGADEIMSTQVVHLEGTAKLIQISIGDEHIPNSFLEAFMVSGYQLYQDRKEIVTPPIANFLNVKVIPDAEGYQPGEKGSYTLEVTDHGGDPVSAEVSLGLVDEAVYTIQSELAGDIRQFFYGRKRGYGIRNASTFEQKSYLRFKPEQPQEDGYRAKDRQVIRREGFAKGDLTTRTAGVGGVYATDELSMVLQEEAEFADNAKSPAGDESSVVVRTDFRATAFWQPNVLTDENGRAKIDLTFPDTLTTWKAKARAVSLKNRFGGGESDVQTRLPLIARLQGPRFFVAGDTLIVSGIFNNNTSRSMRVQPLLEATGVEVEGYLNDSGELVKGISNPFITAAESEKRVDWQVKVNAPGEVKFKLIGKSEKYGDAMEKSFPIYEHGLEKFVGKSGKVRGDHITVSLDLPKQRKKETTDLSIQVTPSMAVTMLDALPYLIDYPYGCSEQTMSRFLPAVIVANTLSKQGIDKETIKGKMFGGIERKYITDTHSNGRRDLSELDAMVSKGLRRLYDLQHASGGWGWWEEDDDDHFMSAYVTWGFTLAQGAGVEIDRSVLQRAQEFLEKEIIEEEFEYDLQAWMLHALSTRFLVEEEKKPSRFEAKAFLNLMKNREQLNVYTRALLALSAKHFGFEEDARLLAENLRNGVKIDERPDQSILVTDNNNNDPSVMKTAHWGEDGIYWRWSDGGVEATAFALMALLSIDPNSDLIDPVTHWLVKNRRGSQWSNTRDTAIVVLALNEYLKISGELESALDYEVVVNGQTVAVESVNLQNSLEVPSTVSVDRDFIKDGRNTIEIRRVAGDGPIYFAVYAEYFSLEEPITSGGNEIFVDRQFYRIKNVPTLLKGFSEEKVLLVDGESLESGERVEVVLTIEGKNNYEYLVFEDLKAAGLEAVQLRSGGMIQAREIKATIAREEAESIKEIIATGDEKDRYTLRSRSVYQELRDRKIASFVDRLPEGYWEIRYRLRAEVPGEFHALPVIAHAMYTPEIRANGKEFRLSIRDRK